MKKITLPPIFLAMNANYMPKEFDGNIFHYTSPQGFQSILFGDRLDTVLWASRYDCLNDSSEGSVAEEVFKETVQELFEQQTINEEQYKLFSSVKTAKTILIYREINGDLKFERVECDRYICSFSKDKDSLAMWNYYTKGNRYEGFNIGFHSQHLKQELEDYFIGTNVSLNVYPVIYKKSEQKELIKTTLLIIKDLYSKEESLRIKSILSSRLVDWGLIFKKEYFEHEKEVRIIINVSKKETRIPIQYRINSGYVIPYIQLKLEKYNVSYVTLGPLQYEERNLKHQVGVMKEMLKSTGYNLANVDYSKIPIRY